MNLFLTGEIMVFKQDEDGLVLTGEVTSFIQVFTAETTEIGVCVYIIVLSLMLPKVVLVIKSIFPLSVDPCDAFW